MLSFYNEKNVKKDEKNASKLVLVTPNFSAWFIKLLLKQQKRIFPCSSRDTQKLHQIFGILVYASSFFLCGNQVGYTLKMSNYVMLIKRMRLDLTSVTYHSNWTSIDVLNQYASQFVCFIEFFVHFFHRIASEFNLKDKTEQHLLCPVLCQNRILVRVHTASCCS